LDHFISNSLLSFFRWFINLLLYGIFRHTSIFFAIFHGLRRKTRKKYKTDKTLMIWILSVFLIRD